jgi:hypothetical protein
VKQRILLGSILWTLLITVLHVWANVGFGAFVQDLRVWAGIERESLRVGFLPVT